MIKDSIGPSKNAKINQIPVGWYNSIKPTQPHGWLIHILISMGEYDNELNLLGTGSIQDCFIRARLISGHENTIEEEANKLLADYIME